MDRLADLLAVDLARLATPAWEKHELQSKGNAISKKEPLRTLPLNKAWIYSRTERQWPTAYDFGKS